MIVPDADYLRTHLIREVHDQVSTAHPGRDKTYQLLKDRYYWKGMLADVERYVRNCLVPIKTNMGMTMCLSQWTAYPKNLSLYHATRQQPQRKWPLCLYTMCGDISVLQTLLYQTVALNSFQTSGLNSVDCLVSSSSYQQPTTLKRTAGLRL